MLLSWRVRTEEQVQVQVQVQVAIWMLLPNFEGVLKAKKIASAGREKARQGWPIRMAPAEWHQTTARSCANSIGVSGLFKTLVGGATSVIATLETTPPKATGFRFSSKPSRRTSVTALLESVSTSPQAHITTALHITMASRLARSAVGK